MKFILITLALMLSSCDHCSTRVIETANLCAKNGLKINIQNCSIKCYSKTDYCKSYLLNPYNETETI